MRHSGKRSASRIRLHEARVRIHYGKPKANTLRGSTSNIIKRAYQHKNNADPKSFAAKYGLHKLMYYEVHDTIEQAIIREKQIKDMNRKDKYLMITKFNPTREDLYSRILDKPE